MAESPLEVVADPLWLRLEWLGYPRGLVDPSMVDAARLDSRLSPVQVEAIRQQAIRQVSYRMREALDAEELIRPPPEDSLDVRPLIEGGIRGPLGWYGPDGWSLRLNDPHRRSFMSYKPSAFSGVFLSTWFHECVSNLKWEKPMIKNKPLPRKACWLTMPDTRYPYQYGGRKWPCQDMPGWLQLITRMVSQACGITDLPNSCNANMYESGNDVVGWHADDEPLFQADRQDALIISLSLGATRTFAFKRNDLLEPVHKLRLQNGDLCVMEGLMQKYYKHTIFREKGEVGPRINLTWRWIV